MSQKIQYVKKRSILAVITALALSGVNPEASAKTSRGKVTEGAADLPARELFRRSLSDLSGDIFLLPQRGNFLLDEDELTNQETFVTSHHRAQVAGQPLRILPPHPLTTHGFAWDYDVRIPLVFYDPKNQWFKRGEFNKTAVQQDIPVTLAAVLGIAPPPRSEGRTLSEALQTPTQSHPQPSKPLPKVIAVVALDQVGWQYLNSHPGRYPFIQHLMAHGANFSHAQVAHVDVETSLGHVAIGSGTYPRGSGVPGNSFFNPGTWNETPIFSLSLNDKSSSSGYPGFYLAPTLSDIWMRHQAGRPVIFSLSAAARASIAMGGHGSLFKGGKKTHVSFFVESGDRAGTFVTDESYFELPASFKDKKIFPYAETLFNQGGGKWFDHPMVKKDGKPNLKLIRATPALIHFESDLVAAGLNELKVGQRGETDLVWINTKSTDYCGHLFGSESEECGEVLTAADASIKRLVTRLAEIAGDDFLIVVTADHGAAPLPELSGAVRLSRDKLLADLNQKFSRPSSGSLNSVLAISSSQIWLNRSELKAAGHTVSDVVQFLKSYRGLMQAPQNMLADEWLAKGKVKEPLFFADVVSREELEK